MAAPRVRWSRRGRRTLPSAVVALRLRQAEQRPAASEGAFRTRRARAAFACCGRERRRASLNPPRVSSGKISVSIAFSRKIGSYCASPRRWSQVPMSTFASRTRSPPRSPIVPELRRNADLGSRVKSARGQPEKSCQRQSTAGLPSTTEMLTAGQHRSVPLADCSAAIASRRVWQNVYREAIRQRVRFTHCRKACVPTEEVAPLGNL